MSATQTTEAARTPPAPALESAHLGIEGMHCASCVARIERELQRRDEELRACGIG